MIYAFFPIFAAICYAFAYIFGERVLEQLNVTSLMFANIFIGTAISILIVGLLVFLKKEPIQIDALKDPHLLSHVLLVAVLSSVGFFFTLFALQNTSASYTAFAEISYPLFTVLFLFLFFGIRQFDWSLLLGGGLVMLGSFILIYSRMRQMS